MMVDQEAEFLSTLRNSKGAKTRSTAESQAESSLPESMMTDQEAEFLSALWKPKGVVRR